MTGPRRDSAFTVPVKDDSMFLQPTRAREPGQDRFDRAVRGEGRAGQVGRSLILRLDLCRGLLAFLVVVAHGLDACWVIHTDSLRALPQATRDLMTYTIQSGSYWVMAFFVISGYCIQLSVGRLQEAGRFPIWTYLAARASRILPLYYLGLLFTLVIELLVASSRPSYFPDGVNQVGWISQLFLLQRPFQTFGAYGATWSISYEFFYYGLFGLLALLAPRQRPGPAWLGMILCSALGGSMLWLYTGGYKNWYTLQIGLFFGLGVNWFLGALAAVHGPSLVRHRAVRVLAAGWPLFFLATVLLRSTERLPLQAIYLLLGASFTLMILRFQAVDLLEADSPRPIPAWLSKAAEVVGLASYPTYLFHGPILLLMASAIARWGLVSRWGVSWFAFAASGIAVGVAMGWWAERPLMAWRANLLRRLKEPAVGRPIARPSAILEAQS